MFGESYFRKEALGNYDDFLSEYLPFYNDTKDIGYMSFITGSHDIKRWSVGRDDEDIKIAYAFIMTMPGVPINYYGDEIGMKYLNITSKEGGRDRTGSRTPMQWSNGKNCGFSNSDTPYLPTDDAPNAPTVESQLAEENSILNFVKKLTKIRQENRALWGDGEYRTIQSGYPLVFERSYQNEKVRIVINASSTDKEYVDNDLKDVILSYKTNIVDGKIKLSGRSCLIYNV